jgi:hypothetical protein
VSKSYASVIRQLHQNIAELHAEIAELHAVIERDDRYIIRLEGLLFLSKKALASVKARQHKPSPPPPPGTVMH